MATYDQPILGTATQQVHGHSYQNINSSDNARVHVGDVHAVYEDPLKYLPYASNAPFNAYYRQHDSDCLPGTRKAVLEKIYEWVEGDEKSCIFWLNGWPGTGKSAIARTVARRYHAGGHLAASFFFVRGGGECNRAGLFVTSIARQLADNKALGMEQIIRAAFGRQILSHTLQDQWTQLIIQPLSKYGEEGDRRTLLIVVDALDECEEEGSIGILLRLLPQVGACKNLRVKILVTSRPETRIRHGFKHIGESIRHAFVLHNISSDIVNRDIQAFLEYRFLGIATACYFPNSWPGAKIIECMVELAEGLFIWAETACNFLEEDPDLAEGRLNGLTNRIGDTLPEPQRQLDRIYTTVLSASVPHTCSQPEQKRIYDCLRLLLGAITIFFSTLPAGALSQILEVPIQDMLRILSRLHSILDFGEDPARPIRLHHDSFRSFLSNELRCLDSRLFVDKKEAHARLVTRCIKVMSSLLKENICGQDGPGVLVSDMNIIHVQQCLPPEAQYACLYWVRHLVLSGRRLLDNGDIHQFLYEHALHWMEAMSWMGKASEAIEAMILLESITEGKECGISRDLVQECKRFLMYARSGIEQAPLQVYVSAALFAPSSTVLREVGRKSRLISYVKRSPPTPEHWSVLLLTLEGHSGAVFAIQFSPDGSKLASASWDSKVMVWDLNTNSLIQTIAVKAYVTNLAFSPDGSNLNTNAGNSKLESGVGRSQNENVRNFHLQVRDDWILRHGHRTIWLPPELRPDACATLSSGLMALGHSSGTISFWDISA